MKITKKITFDGLVAEYGEYSKDGVQYAITQNPYPDYVAGYSTAYVTPGETYYFASGYDRDGNSVRMIWEITNKETEDESDACDWDIFEVQPNYGDPAPRHPDSLCNLRCAACTVSGASGCTQACKSETHGHAILLGKIRKTLAGKGAL